MTEALPLVLKMAMAIAPQDWEPIPEIWSAEGKQTRIGRRTAAIRRVLTMLELLGDPTPPVAIAMYRAINEKAGRPTITLPSVKGVLRETAKAAVAEYAAYTKKKENDHV